MKVSYSTSSHYEANGVNIKLTSVCLLFSPFCFVIKKVNI